MTTATTLAERVEPGGITSRRLTSRKIIYGRR